MIRAFVALPLPELVKDHLARVQSDLGVGQEANPDTFHITLAYLDKQKPDVLFHIQDALAQIRLAPFDIEISGTGVFGGRAPIAVWAGVSPNPALERLRDKVRHAAERSGLRLSRERFRPHITLARLKGRPRPQDHTKVQAFLAQHGLLRVPVFTASEFILFQSTLHPSGALHDVLTTYPLQTAGPSAAAC